MSDGHCQERRIYPLEETKRLPDLPYVEGAPSDEVCFRLWRKYHMLENIQRHSLLVAKIAGDLAGMAAGAHMKVNPAAVRASALLHDIAKTWSIGHECSHASVGASWVVMDTRSYAVAQGVLLHVHWPWPLPQGSGICCLPLLVFYADKRVRHDSCVTLDERFEDLLARYGRTDTARRGIRQAWTQSKDVELALSRQLGINLAVQMWRLEEGLE